MKLVTKRFIVKAVEYKECHVLQTKLQMEQVVL